MVSIGMPSDADSFSSMPRFAEDLDHALDWLARQPEVDPRALIALKGGTLDIVQKSGESERVVWESGKAYWLTEDKPGTTHADVNNGTEPIEVIVVELQQH